MSREEHAAVREDVVDECIELFSNEYRKAKEIHIENETRRLERDWVGIVNLRDALDHLADVFAAVDDNDRARAFDELSDVRSHIQRAAVEGTLAEAERHVEYVKDHRLPSILYWITLRDAPTREQHVAAMRTVKRNVNEGRNAKGDDWEQALKRFEAAKEEARRLRDRTPSKHDVVYRLLVLCAALLTITFTVAQVV